MIFDDAGPFREGEHFIVGHAEAMSVVKGIELYVILHRKHYLVERAVLLLLPCLCVDCLLGGMVDHGHLLRADDEGGGIEVKTKANSSRSPGAYPSFLPTIGLAPFFSVSLKTMNSSGVTVP